MLADDYLQARKSLPTGPQNTFKRGSPLKCFAYGKLSYIKKDYQQEQKRDLKDIKCFNCQQRGHLAVNCQHGATFCSEHPVDNSAVSQTSAASGQGLYTPGKVKGTTVESIVLHTGCSTTLVRSNLVTQDEVLEGEVVVIQCAHGDTVLYPLALVDLEINGYGGGCTV